MLKETFGDYKIIGRKYDEDAFSNRFNKVLFEVEIFYFLHLDKNILSSKETFITALKNSVQKMLILEPLLRVQQKISNITK